MKKALTRIYHFYRSEREDAMQIGENEMQIKLLFEYS